jgi:hypothetical protein
MLVTHGGVLEASVADPGRHSSTGRLLTIDTENARAHPRALLEHVIANEGKVHLCYSKPCVRSYHGKKGSPPILHILAFASIPVGEAEIDMLSVWAAFAVYGMGADGPGDHPDDVAVVAADFMVAPAGASVKGPRIAEQTVRACSWQAPGPKISGERGG